MVKLVCVRSKKCDLHGSITGVNQPLELSRAPPLRQHTLLGLRQLRLDLTFNRIGIIQLQSVQIQGRVDVRWEA